jgi:hypothetical protein
VKENRSWLERMESDPSLRAFRDAEVARAGISEDSAQWRHEFDQQAIETLTRRLEANEAALRKAVRTLRRFLPGYETSSPPESEEE